MFCDSGNVQRHTALASLPSACSWWMSCAICAFKKAQTLVPSLSEWWMSGTYPCCWAIWARSWSWYSSAVAWLIFKCRSIEEALASWSIIARISLALGQLSFNSNMVQALGDLLESVPIHCMFVLFTGQLLSYQQSFETLQFILHWFKLAN